MNKDKFIVGDDYVYIGSCDPCTFLGHAWFTEKGMFRNPLGEQRYYKYEDMTPCTRPKVEFELDEEIEVSSYEDFSFAFKVTFKHQNPNDGLYYGVDKNGYMFERPFARKIEEKVAIIILGCPYNYEIPTELADKIKRGDV
jgi:hypothetical protein